MERSLDKKEKRKDRLIGALVVFPRHVFFFFFYYSFTLFFFFFFFKLIITFCSKIFHIRVKEKEKKEIREKKKKKPLLAPSPLIEDEEASKASLKSMPSLGNLDWGLDHLQLTVDN